MDQPTSSLPPTGPPLAADWKQRLASKWWSLKLADQAAQLAAGVRRQRIVEHAVQQAHDAAFSGGARQTPWPAELEEDMGVRVGDEMHYHLQPAAAPSGAGPSALAKLAGAALLVALGAAGPAIGKLALDALAAYVAPPAAAPAPPVVGPPAPAFEPPAAPEVRPSTFNADFGLSFPDEE